MVDKNHMNTKFDNSLEVVGHEFGELEGKREKFIKRT